MQQNVAFYWLLTNSSYYGSTPNTLIYMALQLGAKFSVLGRLLAYDYGCLYQRLWYLGILSATPKADKQSLRKVRRKMLGEIQE
jgi:hypothetical protein